MSLQLVDSRHPSGPARLARIAYICIQHFGRSGFCMWSQHESFQSNTYYKITTVQQTHGHDSEGMNQLMYIFNSCELNHSLVLQEKITVYRLQWSLGSESKREHVRVGKAKRWGGQSNCARSLSVLIKVSKIEQSRLFEHS